MIRSLLVLAIAALLGGCNQSSSSEREAAPEAVEAAITACTSGDTDKGIDALDPLVLANPAAVDAVAARGICKWARYAADSARADAKDAYDDLTTAIQNAEKVPEKSLNMTLDRLYSHRAFIAVALNPDSWDRTISDLDKAARINPGFPTHVLDRGVARLMSGDSTGARSDFASFLVAAPTDTARVEMVRNMIAELDGKSAWVPVQ